MKRLPGKELFHAICRNIMEEYAGSDAYLTRLGYSIPMDELMCISTGHSLEVSYDILSRKVYVSGEVARALRSAARYAMGSDAIPDRIYCLLAQAVMHGASFGACLAETEDGVEHLLIRSGLSSISGDFSNGRFVRTAANLEVLNTLVSNYLLLRAVRNYCSVPGLYSRLLRYFSELDLFDTVNIVHRIETLSSRAALEKAYFEGDLYGVSQGLWRHGINYCAVYAALNRHETLSRASIDTVLDLLSISRAKDITIGY